MATPGTARSAGFLNSGVLTANALLLKPHVDNQLFDYNKEERAVTDMFIQLGNLQEVKRQTGYWFEKSNRYTHMEISTSVAVGAGDDATVNVKGVGKAGGGFIQPFNVNDTVYAYSAGGFYYGMVTAITVDAVDGTHEYTIKPHDTTVNWGDLDDGDLLFYMGTAFADGDGQPKSKVSQYIQKQWSTQIQKATVDSDRSAGSEQTHLEEIDGKQYVWNDMIKDAILDMRVQRDQTFLRGVTNDNLVQAAGAHARGTEYNIQTTQGLQSVVDTDGVTDTGAALNYAELQAFNLALDTINAPQNYMMLSGANVSLDVDSALFDKVDQTGFNPNAFRSSDAEDLFANFHFSGFKISERTFMHKKWGLLTLEGLNAGSNQAGTLSAPGPKECYFLPINGDYGIKNDRGQSGKVKSVTILYKPVGNGTLVAEAYRDWMSDVSQRRDQKAYDLISETAPMFAGAEFYGKYTKN